MGLYCWAKAGSDEMRVVTEPTRAELHRHWIVNAIALAVSVGLALLTMPPFRGDQPADGFVIEGGGVPWLLPAIFFVLAGGGLLAFAGSIVWIGALVSRPPAGPTRGGLEGRAGAAAQSWGRRHPRGMVVVFLAFLLITAPFMVLAEGRRIVADREQLLIDGYLELTPESMPWDAVATVVMQQAVATDGERKAALRFEFTDGRAAEIRSDRLWPLSEELLQRIETFCVANSIVVRTE